MVCRSAQCSQSVRSSGNSPWPGSLAREIRCGGCSVANEFETLIHARLHFSGEMLSATTRSSSLTRASHTSLCSSSAAFSFAGRVSCVYRASRSLICSPPLSYHIGFLRGTSPHHEKNDESEARLLT